MDIIFKIVLFVDGKELSFTVFLLLWVLYRILFFWSINCLPCYIGHWPIHNLRECLQLSKLARFVNITISTMLCCNIRITCVRASLRLLEREIRLANPSATWTSLSIQESRRVRGTTIIECHCWVSIYIEECHIWASYLETSSCVRSNYWPSLRIDNRSNSSSPWIATCYSK